jgi:hypothetical protein
MLTGADATTYNQSSTTMQYIPKGPKSIITQESIVFNTSTTFSELYQSLSKATHKLGKVYEKSVDDQLTIFAERYYTMAEEVKNLSRVIKTQLPSYDKTILFSDAAIEDGVWSDYCTIFCPILGAALCASCIAGFAPGCVLCVTYATQLSMGCAMGCLAIQYLEEQGGQPSAKYYAQYLTAATWYPTDSPTAHVWNGNNLLEPYSDHQFAQIYAGNYQEQAAVVVQLNNWAGGDIWITGFSYQGYFTSYQVWVSDDNSDWGQNPLYSSTLPYSMWPNPPNVNHDFYGGNSGYDTFRYIAIVCYDSGNSCNLMVDCISVNS